MSGERTQQLPAHRRLWAGRWRSRTLLVAVATIMAVAVGGWMVALVQGRADEAATSAAISRDNAAQIAEQVRVACQRGGQTAAELGDLCRQADEVLAAPEEPIPGPRGEPGQPGPPGRPPTDAEVFAAVSAVLDRHGVAVPPALIAAEVAAHLQANPLADGEPGPPGPPPTGDQLQAAVEAWVVDNLDRIRGPQGEQGEQGPAGPGPDPEQVAEEVGTAVAQWFADNPLPVCPDGTQPEAVTLLTVDRGPQEAVVCIVAEPEPDPEGEPES